MKYSHPQAAPAHSSAGRRATLAHQGAHSPQHAVPRPGVAAAKPGAMSLANVHGFVPDGFVPDLATGAQSLTDSLDILVHLAAANLGRFAGTELECAAFLSRVNRVSATAATGTQAARLAALEQEVWEGPLTEALTGHGTVAMNHVSTDFRWTRYRPQLQDAGFESVLGLRLRLDEGADAALVFFASSAQVFPLQVVAEARSFAELAAGGLRLVLELQAASSRAADLKSALESRTSIDIACGVIMAQNRCSYNEAIAIIAKASSHRNVKLRKVAEGILENLPGGTPRTHFEH